MHFLTQLLVPVTTYIELTFGSALEVDGHRGARFVKDRSFVFVKLGERFEYFYKAAWLLLSSLLEEVEVALGVGSELYRMIECDHFIIRVRCVNGSAEMEMTTRNGFTYLCTSDIFALILAIRSYETPILNILSRGEDFNIIGPLLANSIADCLRRRGERHATPDALRAFYQQHRDEIISAFYQGLNVDGLNHRQSFFMSDLLTDLENDAWDLTYHSVVFALERQFAENRGDAAMESDPEGSDGESLASREMADNAEEEEEAENEDDAQSLSSDDDDISSLDLSSSESDSDESYVTFSDLSTIDNWMSDDDIISSDDGYGSL